MENKKFEKLVADTEKLLTKVQKMNECEDVSFAQADKLSYLSGEIAKALNSFNQCEIN